MKIEVVEAKIYGGGSLHDVEKELLQLSCTPRNERGVCFVKVTLLARPQLRRYRLSYLDF